MRSALSGASLTLLVSGVAGTSPQTQSLGEQDPHADRETTEPDPPMTTLVIPRVWSSTLIHVPRRSERSADAVVAVAAPVRARRDAAASLEKEAKSFMGCKPCFVVEVHRGRCRPRVDEMLCTHAVLRQFLGIFAFIRDCETVDLALYRRISANFTYLGGLNRTIPPCRGRRRIVRFRQAGRSARACAPDLAGLGHRKSARWWPRLH